MTTFGNFEIFTSANFLNLVKSKIWDLENFQKLSKYFLPRFFFRPYYDETFFGPNRKVSTLVKYFESLKSLQVQVFQIWLSPKFGTKKNFKNLQFFFCLEYFSGHFYTKYYWRGCIISGFKFFQVNFQSSELVKMTCKLT